MSNQQPEEEKSKVEAQLEIASEPKPDAVADSQPTVVVDPKPNLVADPQPEVEGYPPLDPELVTERSTSASSVDALSAVTPGLPEVEWIPGEQLELIRIPAPTIWPTTLALGTTGIAFGVVTHWILSAAGLFLFLLGAVGWIEDLRNDVLQ